MQRGIARFLPFVSRSILIICFFVTSHLFSIHAQVEKEPLRQRKFIIHLVQAMNLESQLPENPTIHDYIELIESRGIKIPGGYRPDEYITTKQMAIMLVPAMGLEKTRFEKIKGEISENYKDKAIIIDVIGKVKYKLKDTDRWLDAKPGVVLTEEDTISTEKKAKLILRVGQISIVTIKEDTVLTLYNMSKEPTLYLEKGEIILDTHDVEKETPYYIVTPTTVTAIRGTVLRKVVKFSKRLRRWITMEECYEGKLPEYEFPPTLTAEDMIADIIHNRVDIASLEGRFEIAAGQGWEEVKGFYKLPDDMKVKVMDDVSESNITAEQDIDGESSLDLLVEEGVLSEEDTQKTPAEIYEEVTALVPEGGPPSEEIPAVEEEEAPPAAEEEEAPPSAEEAAPPPAASLPTTTPTIQLPPVEEEEEEEFPDVTIVPETTPTATPELTITTDGTLSEGIEGVAYSATLSASGGVSPYSWSLSSGSLPDGLDLSSGGVISGTPASGSRGTHTFTVQVTDSDGNTASKEFSLKIGYYTTTSAQDDYVWAVNQADDSITRIYKADLSTTDITVGGTPNYVSVDNDYAWVSNFSDNCVRRINKSDLTQTVISSVNTPLDICVDKEYVWVTNRDDDTVTRINKSNFSDKTTIAVGDWPRGICADNDYVWAANAGTDNVTRINKSDLTTTSISVGDAPLGIAIDSDYVWVANVTDDNATRINKTDLSTTTVSAGNAPGGVAVDNEYVWVPNSLDDNVTRINKTDLTTTNIAAGVGAYFASVDDGYVWVTNTTAGTVSRINKADLTKTDISVGNTPVGIDNGYDYDMFFAETYLVDPHITGRIYDSTTGENIDSPIVSIYPKDSLIALASATNNPYSFNVANGYYYFRVEKEGYTFPSNTVNGITAGDHGEVFYASGTSMTIDIPIDSGYPLEITKTANKRRVVNGDIITYDVKIKNNSMWAFYNINIKDQITNGFKYVGESTYVDNTQLNETDITITNRNATFKLTNVPGYAVTHLTYQVRVGTGISPGEYKTTAVAWDRLRDWQMSNETSCKVEVVADALFTMGTIIGKVFNDINGDGIQQEGEEGIEGVRIVTEYGVVVETDRDGKYHIPAVPPGNHLLKVDSTSLKFTTDNPYFVKITEGLLAKVNFGVIQVSGPESQVPSQNRFFIVALAEGIVRNLDTSGNIEMVDTDDRFDDGIKVDGKLALYLRGKIKGKYLITASFDTDRRPGRRGKMYELRKLFTNLDPDKYYPVYGDASKIGYEAADTQDELYLLVEWDKSHLKWGSFNTEIPLYNRTMQGASIVYESVGQTKFGDPWTKVTAFYARAYQIAAHDEFVGTGGSLYYLRHVPVIEGSEKVRVELRDQVSKEAIGVAILIEEEDYEIDYDTGRILLKKPLSSVNYNYSASIISNDILSGARAYLIVDYEYEATSSIRREAYGAKASQQIGHHIKIGGTYIEEEKADRYYKLMGADGTVKLNIDTEVTAEYSRSEETQLSGAYSIDGGLSYNTLSNTANDDETGSSFSIKGRTKLFGNTDIKLGYTRQDDNYSATTTLSTQGSKVYTGSVLTRLTENLQIGLRHITQEVEDAVLAANLIGNNKVHTTTGMIDYIPNRWDIRLEYQHQETKNPFEDFTYGGTRQLKDHDIIGGRIGYKLTDRIHPYLGGQCTLNGQVNNQGYIGAELRLWENTYLRIKETVGNLGNSTLLGLTSQLKPGTEAYTNIEIGNNAQLEEGARSIRTTYGQRTQIDQDSAIYWERDYSSWQSNILQGELVGYETKLTDTLSLGAHYERSQIEKEPTAISRDTGSITLSYLNIDTLKLFSKLELREDRDTNTKRQWVTQNNFLWQVTRDISLGGRGNWGVTQNRTQRSTDAQFHELGIGLAYRPIRFDRLNLLAKYGYITNDMPESQNDFYQAQQDIKHIYAVEGAFDIFRYLQLVGKFAMRDLSEKVGPRDWTESDTYLYIARTNFHIMNSEPDKPFILRGWDLGVEYRVLANDQIEDSKEGFLVELDKDIGNYIRLGAGYNFTDYDDDLSNSDNYDAEGWFVRVNGKY